MLFEIDDGDIGTLTRHGDGYGAADPAVATADQRHFAGELGSTRKSRLEVRRRRHFLLAAGLMPLLLRGLTLRFHVLLLALMA